MEYNKKEMFSYNLHHIKTDKFKDTTIKFSFKSKYKKEDIAILNLISGIVTYASKNYQSEKEVRIKCEELFDTKVSTDLNFYNDVSILTFTLRFLNEEYTKTKNLEETILFFLELLFNPNIIDNSFIQKDLDIVKKEIYESINDKKNNKSYMARRLLLENMGSDDELYKYSPLGNIVDYENITGAELYEAYNNIIQNNVLDIFVLSSDNHDEIDDIFVSNIPISTYKKPLKIKNYNHDEFKAKFKKVEVDSNSAQTNICIGYKIKKTTDFENRYVSWMFNMIFGGDASSKLFQIIREKHNLVYHISSNISQPNSLLTVSCGTSYENTDKIMKYTKSCLKDMVEGNFSDENIEDAKNYLLTLFDSIFDYREQIIGYYNGIAVYDLDDMDVKREQVLKITKKDIKKYASKLCPDTVLVLKGVNTHEGN